MVQIQKMPTYDKMLWPTLQSLKNTDGSASNQELLPKVIQIMEIPEEFQNVPHGAGPRTEVEYRLYWARYYLRKVGAIESSERGVWSITPSGRALTELECKQIPARVREIFRKNQPKSHQDQEIPESENGVIVKCCGSAWHDQAASLG